VVEADNVSPRLASFPLNADKLLRIDVIAIVRRIIAVLPAGRGELWSWRPSVGKLAKEHTTAFIGIGFLSVPAK